jgi:hypothetical protein
MRSKSITFACSVAFVAASFGHAANTGSLSGSVSSSSGEPLAGVTVSISSDALIGGDQVTASDANGRYSFHLLPVGVYTVQAGLGGFVTATGEVRVMSNHVGSVSFLLVPERFSGEIEVSADVPVVDTTQVNSGVVWDDDFLQKAGVGTANRYYQDVLSQAPGVSGGSNPNVHVGTAGDNAYLIDGMNTTDPAVGTWGTIFNIDAVQELSLQTGGYEAEFGQATGGIVNLVTKSGGNQFSGSFDARYRGEDFTESGEHYDPDELREWRQQYSATLGGPILRDRLWFFTSLQYINYTRREADAHFTREWKGWQLLAKATWQASASNRVIFRYSTDPAEIPGNNMGRLALESAMETQEQGGEIYQLELNSVLSDSVLLVAQLGSSSGFTRVFPTWAPETLSGHWNEDTEVTYNSSGWVSDDPRSRHEARLNATWVVDDLAGSHEIKGGLEYNRLEHEGVSYATGGGWLTDFNPGYPGWDPVDLNGDGYINHYATILEPAQRVRDPLRASGDIAIFFLQDTWRPATNLTVKPGIRLDRVTHDNSADERIADMKLWQPRLGLAWDLLGNARHVLRLSAGRFMDPTSLILPSAASGLEGVATHEYNTLEYYCNVFEGLYCDEESLWTEPIHWTNWDGQEYVLIDDRDIPLWPDTVQTVDQLGVGRLRAPYFDGLVLAYETQIAPEASIELSHVKKRAGDLIEDTCSGNAWAYGAAPYPSLDDPSTWTRSDECDSWLIVNMPGLEREYDAWIVRFEGRKGWGHLMASYTFADARMNSISGPSNYATWNADFFPVGFYNKYGQFGRQHRVKLNGYALLPKGFTVGVDGYWSSPRLLWVRSSCGSFREAGGFRSTSDQMAALGIDRSTLAYCTTPDGADLDESIIHSPGGSVESGSLWQLDLQLSKTFRLGAVDLQAILTVYNLFSQEQEWECCVNTMAFLQDTDSDGNGLFYQDDDPTAPYYDEYYGADGSPVLVPVGETLSYLDPRRYEIGFRIEF